MKQETLRAGFTEPIRDPLWGHIYMTGGIAALCASPPFVRLHRIFQLGPAFLTYPGATHTRAGHSIGVYHLARRLLLNLLERGADSFLSAEGAFSFLCAALLHDLGHFPYTHSLKELPLVNHEALTARAIMTEPLKSLVGACGADPAFCAAIVDSAPETGSRSGEIKFYHRLLSGALDPDKLDYLNRDARYCGVPYGDQDVDFIFSRVMPEKERGIDIDSRLVPSVESILFSKYLMYRTVYWHRQVRSATAMIKKALLGGLRDGIIHGGDLYGLDDQELFGLLQPEKHPLFRLASLVREGALYGCAASFPFDAEKHDALVNPENRALMEEKLAEELSSRTGKSIKGSEIIIDIPEAVNFESGLFIQDENRFFDDSEGNAGTAECGGAVFGTQTINSFKKALRLVRIFSGPSLPQGALAEAAPYLQNTENWLQ